MILSGSIKIKCSSSRMACDNITSVRTLLLITAATGTPVANSL